MATAPPPAKLPARRRDLVRPLLALVLALSLFANAALLLTHRAALSRRSLPSSERKPAETRSSEPPSAPTDLHSLAASLHDSAVPIRLTRAYLAAEIDEKFRERTTALRRPKNPALHWWQTDHAPVPLANRLAQLALHREISRLRVELLGPDPDAPDDGSSLPPAKREAARLLAADYSETIDAITERFQLPAEKAALASLEAQRKAELAALLTPTELADFEFRTSSTTEEIRDELHGFDATDQEFAAIHEFWKRDSAEQGFLGHMFVSEEEIAAPLKAVLGEARFAEFQLARHTDPESEKLRSLVSRASLPPETAAEVVALRSTLEQESARIGGDSSSVAEKLVALQALARDTREKIQTKLGPDAAAAYLPNAELWLSLVERGDVIHFQPNGWEGTPVTLPPPPKDPATPP